MWEQGAPFSILREYLKITPKLACILLHLYSTLFKNIFFKMLLVRLFLVLLCLLFSRSTLINSLFKSNRITSSAIVRELDILLLLLSKQMGKVQRKVIFYWIQRNWLCGFIVNRLCGSQETRKVWSRGLYRWTMSLLTSSSKKKKKNVIAFVIKQKSLWTNIIDINFPTIFPHYCFDK